MIDISVEKLFLLLVIAVLVLGPTELHEYAAKLGRVIRELRRMASGAQEGLRKELGPDFDGIDWHKMDPVNMIRAESSARPYPRSQPSHPLSHRRNRRRPSRPHAPPNWLQGSQRLSTMSPREA